MIGKYSAKLDEKNRLFVPAKLRNDRKSFLISQMQLLVVSKCIQKVQMVFLIKEGGAVVLAVDVDELHTQLM